MIQHQPLQSGFRPEGEPQTMTTNPWFTVERQPMTFVDPVTGSVKKSAEDGGQMNYMRIKKPGVLIVAALGKTAGSTLLVPQERYTTNLVEKRPVRHYELPGGAIDHDQPTDHDAIRAAAQQEFQEEMGYGADKYVVLGSTHRGLLTHPLNTDHNFTVLALGAAPLEGGASHEDNEILGAPEDFTWEQVADMYLHEDGLYVPGSANKVISSAPTVASLALAQTYLQRQANSAPIHIDL